jgi:hypothetical protein
LEAVLFDDVLQVAFAEDDESTVFPQWYVVVKSRPGTQAVTSAFV